MISTSICTIVQFTMCYIVYCIISLVYISADTMCTLAQTQANQRTQKEQKKKQKKKTCSIQAAILARNEF